MSPVAAAHGYRTTSASANLKNQSDNLHILTEATVKRIIFDGLKATGVELFKIDHTKLN
jgi:choline dehydrogenase-like flavoprotein